MEGILPEMASEIIRVYDINTLFRSMLRHCYIFIKGGLMRADNISTDDMIRHIKSKELIPDIIFYLVDDSEKDITFYKIKTMEFLKKGIEFNGNVVTPSDEHLLLAYFYGYSHDIFKKYPLLKLISPNTLLDKLVGGECYGTSY